MILASCLQSGQGAHGKFHVGGSDENRIDHREISEEADVGEVREIDADGPDITQARAPSAGESFPDVCVSRFH